MATRFDTPDLEPRKPPAQSEGDDDETFAVIELAMLEVQALTDRLATGAITVDEWRDEMADVLTTYHLVAWMIGAGTEDAPADTDLDGLATALAEQLDYLEGFYEALKELPEGSELGEKQRNRAEMYAIALKGSVSRGRTSGIELPFFPTQYSDCRIWCCCSWVIRDVDPENGDYDAVWRLGPCNHCPQCPERALRLNPLRVRNGKYDRSQITKAMYN